MDPWREWIVAFCRWRVQRNGMASGRWLNFADWIANGDHPEDYE